MIYEIQFHFERCVLYRLLTHAQQSVVVNEIWYYLLLCCLIYNTNG